MDEQDSRQQVVRLTADRGAVPLWDTDEPEALSWEGLPLSAAAPGGAAGVVRPLRHPARHPVPVGGARAASTGGRPTDVASRRGSSPSSATGYRVEYDGP